MFIIYWCNMLKSGFVPENILRKVGRVVSSVSAVLTTKVMRDHAHNAPRFSRQPTDVTVWVLLCHANYFTIDNNHIMIIEVQRFMVLHFNSLCKSRSMSIRLCFLFTFGDTVVLTLCYMKMVQLIKYVQIVPISF